MGDADDDDSYGKNTPENFFAAMTVVRCRMHREKRKRTIKG
jgi:hypothetical protein